MGPIEKAVTSSQATSYWLAGAIRQSSERDPVDALHDAKALVAVLQERWNVILGEEGDDD